MAANKALLLAQQERLRRMGEQVSEQAEVFHRDRLALLAEVASALSWRGLFAGGDADERSARVDTLVRLGEGLARLFERVTQVKDRLDGIDQTLGRIKERRLTAPDCVPAMAERVRLASQRLGRDVKVEDDLIGDLRRCDQVQADVHGLSEALKHWASAEEVLNLVRSQTRSGPLAAALPDLCERLCRDGPTAEWLAELQEKLEPLEQLARREQPQEIRQTDRIVRHLPRWVDVLGNEIPAGDQDAVSALVIRFKAKRKDWAGEDDRVFQDLLAEAARLEQGVLERATELRAAQIEDLDQRYKLFASLARSDELLEQRLKDLRLEEPGSPLDHEEWCDQLREARDTLDARVKGAENDLLNRLRQHLADCRGRLDAMNEIARLDEQDALLKQAGRRYAELRPAAEGIDTRDLLDKAIQAGELADELRDLERAMQADYAGLQDQRGRLIKRAQWLHEQSTVLGIALAASAPDPAQLVDPNNRQTNLQQERVELEERERLLADAEVGFANACTREIDRANQRIGQMTAVIAPERIRAAGLDLDVLPDLEPGDLVALVEQVARVRTRLAGVERLLADEEQARAARIEELRERLAAVSPEQLGHTERAERDQILRQLERWEPSRTADPMVRIGELCDLIAVAESILSQFEAALRELKDRRDQLQDRLRRFNSLFLQSYCPELYLRIDGLLHPPAATRWPKDAEAHQLREADRLLSRLERQSERLAAREIAEHLAVLDQHADRTDDHDARALVDEITALPPEQPPPAHLRRRLAELARPLLRWR